MRGIVGAIIVSAAMAADVFNPLGDDYIETCWVKAYGRGAGKVPDYCDEEHDKSGSRCYNPCQRGFSGNGDKCWQDCPIYGFRDDGQFCYKQEPSYGRGVGQSDECVDCEKYGALWYPKCDIAYHSVGCCVCSHDCPPGWNDIGISCKKPHYFRGHGEKAECDPSLSDKQGGLCYAPCDHNCRDKGPVCWGNCPEKTHMCGGVLCLTDDQSCHDYIGDVLDNIIGAVTSIAKSQTGDIDISKIATDYEYPVCDSWGPGNP